VLVLIGVSTWRLAAKLSRNASNSALSSPRHATG
jgi:hypothetical protein